MSSVDSVVRDNIEPGAQVHAPAINEKLTFSATADSPLYLYLEVLRRRIWLIAGSIVVCCLIALYLTLTTIPLYRATVGVLIEREAARVVKQDDTMPGTGRFGAEFYQTQYGLIRSRNVAEAVVRQLRLADNATLLTGYQGGSDTAASVMAQTRAARTQAAIAVVMRNTQVDPVRNSGLANISFASPDRQLSANVANALATSFIQVNLQRRFDANAYARTFLEGELQRVRGALERSENAVVNYSNRNEIIEINRRSDDNGTIQGASIPELSLEAINAALTQARAARIAAEARARNRSTGQASTDPALATLMQQRAQLQAEYARNQAVFKADYPTMVALQRQISSLDRSIAQQNGRIAATLDADYRSALQQEQQLAAQVSALQNNVQDLSQRRIQLNIFQRDADTNRALYNSLLERYKEIGVAGGIGSNNVSVVDQAQTPRAPFTPNRSLNLMLAVLAGTIIGVAIAFLLEQLDGAIKAPVDIERQLGIPLLGVIPVTSFSNPIDELADRKSDLSEAYLSVQTSLRFSTTHGVPKTLAVTSANEAEGKSTSALSIASSLARMGLKTLLIDVDLRNPSLHKTLGIDKGRGMSDLLSGDDISTAEFHPVGDSGLMAITSGQLPPNPSELLSTSRLADLVAALAPRFDHIVVDAPPVIGLSDAPLIAATVEATVFVIASGDTGAKSAIASLRRLQDVDAWVAGAVLTRYAVNNSGYSYNYNYTYRYGAKDSRRTLKQRLGFGG